MFRYWTDGTGWCYQNNAILREEFERPSLCIFRNNSIGISIVVLGSEMTFPIIPSQRHHPTWEELLQTHMEQFSENSRFYKWHSASDSFSEIFLRLRISLNQEIGPQCYWSCVSHWKPAARKISMEEILESILAELSELSELSESFKLSELSKN